MADFPVVCANYGVQGTVLEGSCQTVCYFWNVRGKGRRVRTESCIGGASTGKKNCEGVVFENPIEAAQRVGGYIEESGKM